MQPLDAMAGLRLAIGPAILAAIFIAHWIYFRARRASDGQQVILLDELVNQPTLLSSPGVSFDAQSRSLIVATLPPRPIVIGFDRTSHRSSDPFHVGDETVGGVLICADDLVCEGVSRFLGAVKVGGDLIVTGDASFAAAVIVNGVLKIEGTAHFAEGVLAKKETFVAGGITIGSKDGAGWASLGELILGERLGLNGDIVASRAVQLKRGAR